MMSWASASALLFIVHFSKLSLYDCFLCWDVVAQYAVSFMCLAIMLSLTLPISTPGFIVEPGRLQGEKLAVRSDYGCQKSTLFLIICPFSYTGTSVTRVTATDADDPVYGNSAKLVYSILEGQPYFSIDPNTGEWIAMVKY